MQFIECARRSARRPLIDAVRHVAAAVALALLAACGGGGSGSSGGTPGVATGQPLISLQSDPGDYIGGGASYAYDTSDAAITVAVRGAYLRIGVSGRENWSGDFLLPGNATELMVGSFPALARYPFQAAGAGGMSWTGQGRGCNTSTSTMKIDAVTYQSGVLQSLDMSFEQHCEGLTAALRGQIHIGAQTMALVSVPQNPLPTTPVLALRSDVGDFIGSGAYYAYDSSSAVITVSSQGNRLSVGVSGDQQWTGEFQLPAGSTTWAPGTYTGLTRYPFNSAATGGLSWNGEGRGCNTLTASMTVDSVRYNAGSLRAIGLRFEQHCEGGIAALVGTLRWDADQPQVTPAPQATAPVGLWAPPAGTFASSGNGMYLASEPGDYIGGGSTWWVGAASPPAGSGGGSSSQGTVTVAITESGGLLRINVDGAAHWTGEFKAMDNLQRLQPGYYGIVHRYPFYNPVRGGMNWSMESRGCNQLSGWFMVDSITYQGSQLESVDLRFSQYCDGSVKPLRGRIRWRSASSAGAGAASSLP